MKESSDDSAEAEEVQVQVDPPDPELKREEKEEQKERPQTQDQPVIQSSLHPMSKERSKPQLYSPQRSIQGSRSYAYLPEQRAAMEKARNEAGFQKDSDLSGGIDDRSQKYYESHVYDSASKVSKYFYWYMWSTIRQGWDRPLEQADLTESPSKSQLKQLYRQWSTLQIPSSAVSSRSVSFANDSNALMQSDHPDIEQEQLIADSNEQQTKHLDSNGISSISATSAVSPPNTEEDFKLPDDFEFLGFNLIRTIWNIHRHRMGQCCLWYVAQTITDLLVVLVFRNLVLWYRSRGSKDRSDRQPIWIGLVFAWLLPVIVLSKAVFKARLFSGSEGVASRVRTLIMALVFHKVQRLPMYARDAFTAGEIVNLMSVDTERIFFALRFFVMVPMSPVLILLSFAAMVVVYNWAALAGFAVICLIFPIQMIVGRFAANMKHESVHFSDRRINFMKECIEGVRVTKMYTWERPLLRVLERLRKAELGKLKFVLFCQTVVIGLSSVMVELVVGTVLIVWSLMGNNVTLATAYTVYLFVRSIFFPLVLLPRAFQQCVGGYISAQRLQRFFDQPELEQRSIKPRDFAKGTTDDDSIVALAPNTVFFHTAMDLEQSIKKDKNVLNQQNRGETPSSDMARMNPSAEDETIAVISDGKANKNNIKGEESSQSSTMRNNNNSKTQGQPCFTIGEEGFSVSKGELVAVIGRVGSGKSSLLNCLLGEKVCFGMNSKVKCNSRKIGLVGEELLIVNDTLRGNVLMEEPFDEEQYELSMDAAAMTDDCRMLPGGDLTEIGQRGINLSGGQKARVCIARVLYRADSPDYSLFLFDDPLSAVDNDVASHIFRKGILGRIQNKACVVTLNSHLHLLKHFDRVVVVEDCRVLCDLDVQRGRNEGCMIELDSILTSKFDFEGFLINSRESSPMPPSVEEEAEAEAEEANDGDGTSEMTSAMVGDNDREQKNSKHKKRDTMKSISAAKLAEMGEDDFNRHRSITKRETKKSGAIASKSLSEFIASAAAGNLNLGLFYVILLLLAQLSVQVVQISSDMWLSWWATENDSEASNGSAVMQPPFSNLSQGQWRSGLLTIILIAVVGSILRPMCVFVFCLRSSAQIHRDVVTSVLSAPVSYFDAMPAGLIINRISHDLSIVDERLSSFLAEFLMRNVHILVYVSVMVVFMPLYLLPLCLLIMVVVYLRRLFIASSRELKRLDGLTRSPVHELIASSVQALSTVRALGLSEYLNRKLELSLDANTRAFWELLALNRWFGSMLELVQTLQLFFISTLCVLFLFYTGSDFISPASAALITTYALGFGGLFQWVVRLSVEVETMFTAVERLGELKEIPHENCLDKSDDNLPDLQDGSLTMTKVCLRYRKDLPLVLRDVSLSVQSGMKVGICGRTGAGKSSLMVALFRLFECDRPPSKIILNGKGKGEGKAEQFDALELEHLQDVRHRLTIIPQSPVLFSGDLRFNLDPFAEHEESELQRVLNQVHLSELDLKMTISEQGSNLSFGQRQLVCIARALLRNPQILLMDEATANVDSMTDSLIQELIRNCFEDCTVITIAHRTNTILGYDLIVYMEDGCVIETGKPDELLKTEGSKFRALCEAKDL